MRFSTFRERYPVPLSELLVAPVLFRDAFPFLLGTPPVSAPLLRDLARAAGHSETAIRTAMSRLRASGLVEVRVPPDGGEPRYHRGALTRSLQEIVAGQLERPDGFTLVVFAFATENTRERQVVREALRLHGFQRLAQNTYIGGCIDTTALESTFRHEGIEDNVFVFRTRGDLPPNVEERLITLFDLRARARVLRALRSDLTALLEDPRLDDAEHTQRLLYAGAGALPHHVRRGAAAARERAPGGVPARRRRHPAAAPRRGARSGLCPLLQQLRAQFGGPAAQNEGLLMTERVVIIGAGVAGMAAAIHARESGFQVDLFERHSVPGGLCTSWRIDGFLFDGCVEFFMGSGASSPFHALWREVGVLPRSFVDRQVYAETLFPDGGRVLLHADPDRLEKHFDEISPVDRDTTRHLVELVRLMRRARYRVDRAAELLSFVERTRAFLDLLPTLRLWRDGFATLDPRVRREVPEPRAARRDHPRDPRGSAAPLLGADPRRPRERRGG